MLRRVVTSYRNAFRGVPRNVWLLSLVLLISRCGTMVLPFLSIYATRELGFTPMKVGWLLSTYGVGGIIGGLLGGWLTGRMGAIRTQIVSFGTSVPGFLLLGQARGFGEACLDLFLLSIAIEIFRPAASTATIEFCDNPGQHTRAMAVNRLAINLGMSIGPTLGGFLAVVNYQLLFWGNAAGVAAAMLLMLGLFGWRAPSHSTSQGIAATGQPAAVSHRRSAWRDARYLAFTVLNILAAIVFFQFLGTYPLYLNTQYQLSEVQIGILYAVNTIVIVLFELVLVNAVVNLPLMRVYAWGQLLSCLGFGLTPLAVGCSFGVGYAWCIVTMLILTTGEMLSMPLGAVYAARRSTTVTRGQYMGLYAASFSIAILIAPIAGMWLYDRNPHGVWYCGLIIGGLVFPGLLRIADRERSDAAAGRRQAVDSPGPSTLREPVSGDPAAAGPATINSGETGAD